MKRIIRSDLFGNKLWQQDSRMAYTSYTGRERDKDVSVEPNNQMSSAHFYSGIFMDHFNDVLYEYAKHVSKLIRQKNAHREQQRNFLPNT